MTDTLQLMLQYIWNVREARKPHEKSEDTSTTLWDCDESAELLHLMKEDGLMGVKA